METIEQMVVAHPFIKGFASEFLPIFVKSAVLQQFPEGHCIFSESTNATHFYLIRSGCIAVTAYVPGRGKVTAHRLTEGEALGWSWLLPPYRWHFGATVLHASEVIALDGKYLREQAAENPAFGYAMAMKVTYLLLQRLSATRALLVDFHGVTE